MGERTPIWDPQARAAWIGLTIRHTHVHLYRAVMEGVAYAYRQMVDILRQTGNQLLYTVAMDGGANSAVWRQIFAEILHLPIHGVDQVAVPVWELLSCRYGPLERRSNFGLWNAGWNMFKLSSRATKMPSGTKLCAIYSSLYPRLVGDFHALGQIEK